MGKKFTQSASLVYVIIIILVLLCHHGKQSAHTNVSSVLISKTKIIEPFRNTPAYSKVHTQKYPTPNFKIDYETRSKLTNKKFCCRLLRRIYYRILL